MLTPVQKTTLKSDMTSGPLSLQVTPLLQLGPIQQTLYDFPAGTLQNNPALPMFGQNIVTYTVNGVMQSFVGLTPVPPAIYVALSPTDQATLIVSHVQAAQDGAIAALYNTVGNETITLQYASKNNVLAVVEKAVLNLASLTPSASLTQAQITALQQKWGLIGPMLVSLLGATDSVLGIEQAKVTALQGAVSDGLLTANDIAAPWTRFCTHAETLFGVGTVLSENDIGQARNL